MSTFSAGGPAPWGYSLEQRLHIAQRCRVTEIDRSNIRSIGNLDAAFGHAVSAVQIRERSIGSDDWIEINIVWRRLRQHPKASLPETFVANNILTSE